MVDYVKDASELRRRINAYSFGSEPSEELARKLQTIAGVEADVITTAPEILYAYKDELGEDGLQLMAELFVHMNEQGWTTAAGGAKGTGNRAEKIIEAVRQEVGELKADPPEPAAWPDPKTEYRDSKDWRGASEPADEAPPVDEA